MIDATTILDAGLPALPADCAGPPPWLTPLLVAAVAATVYLSCLPGADLPFRLPRAGGRPVVVRSVAGPGGRALRLRLD